MVGGGLEGRGKMAGRKRKTVLYWRSVLREVGIDWTEEERLTSDMKGWKEKERNLNKSSMTPKN